VTEEPEPTTIDSVRLAAARLRASELQPFLAIALYALSPQSSPGLGTFAVDERWRLYIDPVMLQRWTVAECAGVLLHEAGHVIRDHAGRARVLRVDGRTKLPWNYAADAEINDDLRADKVTLPGKPVLPETLKLPRHKAAEFYYGRIVDREPPLPPLPDCGSGCHGVDEERLLAGAGVGIGAAAKGLDPSEVMLLRKRVAEEVLRLAATSGKGPGKDAGGWTRWAEALLHPQIDWRRLLTATIRGSISAIRGASDYSYSRPSRRRVEGIVLPALQRPLPTVAVVIDTSGSVNDAQLSAAWTEVHGCLRSLGVRRDLMRVYAVDVDVVEIKNVAARSAPLAGGGGTDMRAGISTALRATPRPDLVVVLTDGYTPWPERSPRPRVVVGLLEGELPAPPTPSWATTIAIPMEDDSS
jgi:predicted metal-dependent peptidase